MEEEEVREMNAYLEEMEHDAREREAEKEQETSEASRNALPGKMMQGQKRQRS